MLWISDLWAWVHHAIAFAIASEFCRKRPFARNFRSENENLQFHSQNHSHSLANSFATPNSQLFVWDLVPKNSLANFRGASEFAFPFAAVSLRPWCTQLWAEGIVESKEPILQSQCASLHQKQVLTNHTRLLTVRPPSLCAITQRTRTSTRACTVLQPPRNPHAPIRDARNLQLLLNSIPGEVHFATAILITLCSEMITQLIPQKLFRAMITRISRNPARNNSSEIFRRNDKMAIAQIYLGKHATRTGRKQKATTKLHNRPENNSARVISRNPSESNSSIIFSRAQCFLNGG